jgi:hypothetical protein
VLVPGSADGCRIPHGQTSEPSNENCLFGSDESIEARNGWFQETSGLPIRQVEVKGSTLNRRGDTADYSISLQVEEEERRSNFGAGSRSKRKLTKKNFAKHKVQRSES